MKKIDLHLHLTPFQIPKLGKLNLTSGENMLPHLEELGIEKGVLMSSGEKGLPFGTNKANKATVGTFFSVRDPKNAMRSFGIFISKIDWSKSESLKALFLPFMYLGEEKPMGESNESASIFIS